MKILDQRMPEEEEFYNNKEEDPALNIMPNNSPGTLETMLDMINFIGKKIDPSLVLSDIRKSKSYKDGIDLVFTTRSKDVVGMSNAIGVAGVAISNYLKRIREKFNLESYL